MAYFYAFRFKQKASTGNWYFVRIRYSPMTRSNWQVDMYLQRLGGEWQMQIDALLKDTRAMAEIHSPKAHM